MDLLNKTGVPIKNLGEELDFQEINKLEQIIKKYENDIFICETKKILNSFSTL